eukprot:TRINITY_DN10546_c0_g1_i1.p1 TRINITY_DN10546_c0_g1~~TRINITY_DN10546_c0_g1_i1.p1  ORF type:complete len:202 (-),score=52.95 TRINITY_DN10546_c0_g1_i1:178-783(-)
MEVSHDDAILNFIFNPAAGLSIHNPAPAPQEIDPLLLKAKKLEVDAVSVAEKDASNLDETIKLLSEAISMVPNYASAYNNRAQAYRLKENFDAALEDLNKAIDLASAAMKSSDGQQREKERTVLKQALAQRVALRKRKDDTEGAEEDRKRLAELTTPDNYYAKLCNETIRHVLANYRDYQENSFDDLPAVSSCSSAATSTD